MADFSYVKPVYNKAFSYKTISGGKMTVGTLVRWQSLSLEMKNKIGLITHRAGGRVRVLWLKDQSAGWYSDYYLEEVCK